MQSSDTALLSAEWRDLVMISYEVDPHLLVSLVPAGTSLDFYNGKVLVSVVGLRFLNMRVAGISRPLHQDFEQVNFRYSSYLGRLAGGRRDARLRRPRGLWRRVRDPVVPPAGVGLYRRGLGNRFAPRALD